MCSVAQEWIFMQQRHNLQNNCLDDIQHQVLQGVIYDILPVENKISETYYIICLGRGVK